MFVVVVAFVAAAVVPAPVGLDDHPRVISPGTFSGGLLLASGEIIAVATRTSLRPTFLAACTSTARFLCFFMPMASVHFLP